MQKPLVVDHSRRKQIVRTEVQDAMIWNQTVSSCGE